MQIIAKPETLSMMLKCAKDIEAYNSAEDRFYFGQAIDEIVKATLKNSYLKSVEASSVSSNFVEIGRGNPSVLINSDNFDRAWELAFVTVPPTPGQLHWEIHDVQNSIVVKQMAEGERVSMEGSGSSKQIVECAYYAGGTDWTDKLIRTNSIAALLNKMKALINAFWVAKADSFYQLIRTAAAFNGYTPLQAAGADNRIQKVVQTINFVSALIGRRNKDKYLGDTARLPLVMYATPEDESIIESAFRVTAANLINGDNDGEAVTSRRIVRQYTYNQFVSQDTFIMCLPGGKNQRMDILDPTGLDVPVDPQTLNRGKTLWALFGGAVGDVEQIQGGNLT